MRLLLLTLVPLTCLAQTAQVPPAPVTGTAQIQGQSATCKIPKNGGICQFTLLPYAAPVTGTTAQVTAPVSLAGYAGTFKCPNVVVTKDAAGNTHFDLGACTMVKK